MAGFTGFTLPEGGQFNAPGDKPEHLTEGEYRTLCENWEAICEHMNGDVQKGVRMDENGVEEGIVLPVWILEKMAQSLAIQVTASERWDREHGL